MSEWWTYSPADLLMFAPRTYWRLFELQNQALWPMPVLTTLIFLAVGLGLLRHNITAMRAGTAALALCWVLVAWSFLLQRYAAINLVGSLSAGAFAVQALGLLVLSGAGSLRTTDHPLRCEIGLGLLAWALLLYPLHALVAGRPLVQAEVFGFAPDPTAIGSLGLLLCADTGSRFARWLLGALQWVAVAWCAVSAATLWTMGSQQGWVPCIAAVIALAVRWHWPHRVDRRLTDRVSPR